MKLTSLTLHRFRDVVPGSTLTFSPAFNLVLGENGTGRTTLLELLSRVLAGDFSGFLHEHFSLEYDLSFPGVDLHVSVSNVPGAGPSTEAEGLLSLRTPLAAAPLAPSMEVTLRLHAPEARLVLRAHAGGVAWEVDGRPGYTQTLEWSLLDRSVWVVLLMMAPRLERDVRERLKELLRRVFLLGPARFDEGLGLFEQLGHIRYGLELRGGELFPLGLMSLPTWLAARLRERVEEGPVTDVLDFSHQEAPESFLARFTALAGFAAGRLRVEVLERRAPEEGGRLELGRFGFHFTRHDGSQMAGEHLGFGQKRLLAFLYHLDVNEDFLLADELANGLHPRWVEACLRGLGERQVFLASQSPLPYAHVPLGSAEEARRSLLRCRRVSPAGREQLHWANPTLEQAEHLFRAYEVGRHPLAELLREQGLW